MKWRVPFFDLDLGEDEINAVVNVLKSNWLTSGPRIEEFEAAFVNAVGCNSTAIAVSSATAALHLSLLCLDIGPGDEVIVPSLTFVACANVIRYVGATPVFADITSDRDWNISLQDFENKITNRTRAVIAVHYAGYACNIESLVEIAKNHNIKVIEDCSHSPIAIWNGKHVGTFGDIGCYSFFSNKNMTTAEGGMLVTYHQEIANRSRMLRSHGITSSTYQRFKGHVYGYDVAEIGYNYRLDEIRAALGIQQLQKLKQYNIMRKSRVIKYRELLAEIMPNIIIPFSSRLDDSSYHIFPILIPSAGKSRNEVLSLMGQLGIQCSVHYRPIHTFTAYQDYSVDLPITNSIYEYIITLPLFPNMTDDQINYVVDGIEKCLASS